MKITIILNRALCTCVNQRRINSSDINAVEPGPATEQTEESQVTTTRIKTTNENIVVAASFPHGTNRRKMITSTY